MMQRAQRRLVELEAAAQQATNPDEKKQILAEEAVIRAVTEPAQVDRLAGRLMHVAINPDKLRSFLTVLEDRKSGSLSYVEAMLDRWEG
jgi:hypothetical protein